ncbi:MAG: ATP-binding cassette domain-containing protein [Nanoarchaeota archaeon]|nr:ATP-binding cassette domain-containing protein [Nanoarchaeota archaeon]MBU4124300.1 ATP-binding cassette domain-containing protein [Nanoarchaeota archaeon]
MNDIIRVNNLSKHYKILQRGEGRFEIIKTFFSRKYKTVKALDKVSFTIGEGDFVGIIGPNGAGKSTLIKILTGILTPTSGEAVVTGFVPYKQRKKYVQNIGVVFGQRTQLWWDLPVRDSFDMLKYIYKVPEKQFKTNMKKFAEILEINDYMLKPVRKLSLGERMRCDMAASLLHNPKIIFLDEPTIGLDVEAKYKLREFLKEVNKLGVTIILTTHDMGDIEELCPRTIMVDHGKIVIDAPTKDIKNKISSQRTLLIDFKGAPPKLKNKKGMKIVSKEGDRIMITIDTRKHSVSSVMKMILKKYEVDDITISEPSIEENVRKIYRGEL